MKKLMAVLVVVVLMVPVIALAVTVVEAQDVIDQYKRKMKAYCDFYDKSPDQFDDDHAYWMYGFYQMYVAAGRMKIIESEMTLKSHNGGVIISEADKMLEESRIMMNDLLDDQFKKWLNGEVPDEDFYSLIVELAKVTLQDS